MKINLSFAPTKVSTELNIYSCFNKTQEVKVAKSTSKAPAAKAKAEKVLVHTHWPEEVSEAFDPKTLLQ